VIPRGKKNRKDLAGKSGKDRALFCGTNTDAV
jgi:hypothetical protein